MKYELDSEQARVRQLMNERDMSVNQTMDRIESLTKELTNALNKASMFQAQSLIAEVMFMIMISSELEMDVQLRNEVF